MKITDQASKERGDGGEDLAGWRESERSCRSRKEGCGLPAQQGEEQFRNEARQRYMVEHVRPSHLPNQE